MAEAVTTLGPTRLQDGTTGSSAHAGAEAMLAGLATIIWLKGALHGASCETSSRRSRGLIVFLRQRRETNAIQD
jgi:hypothetical protein